MATAETPSAPRRKSQPRKSAPGARRTTATTKATTAKATTAKATRTAARRGRGPAAAGRRPTKAATARPMVSRGAVTVPFVNVRVPVLRAHVPGADAAKEQTKWAAHTVRSYLPPVDRLLYYGGLGTAAAVGALEWPVAVAAGAGVWVATHARRQPNRASAG